MQKSAAAALFDGWEEVFVTNDKGRKEVHYFLKRKDGGSDLAVVGKERRLKHMSYYYALRNRSVLLSLAPSSSLAKLRSRKDVVDWLSSVVTDGVDVPSHPSQKVESALESEDCRDSDGRPLKLQKSGHHPKGFSWLGSSWTCKKRRRHYRSFSRSGVTIYVYDFVYVMAEENKRLVAYLEDLYEDTKGNKMVVVRWFHKVDEVGSVSPADFNGREIFFSVCLQDLSVECIDGLATILSPQHFEKFQNEAKHTKLDPFVCHRMVDNDDVKPFDITQVQGYWRQEILRYMYTTSECRTDVKHGNINCGQEGEGNDVLDFVKSKPKKQRTSSGDVGSQLHLGKNANDAVCEDLHEFSKNLFIENGSVKISAPMVVAAGMSRKESDQQRSCEHLSVGSHVEVFSQDSGIRGCWFRALVLKKHKEKLKVQYQDIQDAADESINLEEWVLASKVLEADYLGLRLKGRMTVRPFPLSDKGQGQVSWSVDVGSVVDAWWCDGWWEGIVVQKESEDRIHVFFPGERQKKIFGHGDLRRSQDWVVNKWMYIKERPDIATSVLSGLGNGHIDGKSFDGSILPSVTSKKNCDAGVQADVCNGLLKHGNRGSDLNGISKNAEFSLEKEVPCFEPRDDEGEEANVLPNLVKDDLFVQLRWKSSRKRRRSRESSRRSLDSKNHVDGSSSSSSLENVDSTPCDRFLNPKSLNLDHDNCKFAGDAILNASVPFASLVMSR